MPDFELSFEASETMRRFNRLPREVQEGVRKGLARALLLTEERIRSNTGVRFTGAREGLGRRLTSYARKDAVLGVDAAVGFARGSGFPYEYAQEFGAKAKPGKAMAIPVSRVARAASQRGIGPRQLFPAGALAIVKAGGRALLIRKSATRRTRRIEVEYVLVKSIPPRLRFMQSVRASMPDIDRGITDGAEEAWGRA
jgi:hypothetical protein